MLRLIAFGGLTLLQNGRAVTGAAASRRRLAAFALLSASGPRGIDRNTLADLLWPDKGPELARHSLDQLVFAVRRAFGSGPLLAGAPTLHLDSACITSDVWEFESAIRRRELETAVTLYRGAFADGFVIPGTDALQRRLDAIRTSYAREYTTALEALAREATSRGDVAARARWWRLLADADPLSARVARELIEALVAAGEWAKALEFALLHVALVRQELDAPPDPEIARWILRLRAMSDSSVQAGGRATPVEDGAKSSGNDADGLEGLEDYTQRLTPRVARAVSGKYHVEHQIDAGSLAASYAAVALTGARPKVEIHVVQPLIAAMASPKHYSDVFARVVRLAHGRIHPTLSFGRADELLYYVTAPRPPVSLRERLARDHELPIRDAIGIARDLAAALGHAHTHHVWHGDLRPKHIGLTTSGAVLSSLGVIDAITPEAAARDGSTVVALGSPAYLSPEQLTAGVPGDARSDVYAFGCIVYEMLTGEPPFGRPSRPSAFGAKVAQPPPPLRSRREAAPEALEAIVHICLARVPADRYSSGEELCRALAEVDSVGKP